MLNRNEESIQQLNEIRDFLRRKDESNQKLNRFTGYFLLLSVSLVMLAFAYSSIKQFLRNKALRAKKKEKLNQLVLQQKMLREDFNSTNKTPATQANLSFKRTLTTSTLESNTDLQYPYSSTADLSPRRALQNNTPRNELLTASIQTAIKEKKLAKLAAKLAAKTQQEQVTEKKPAPKRQISNQTFRNPQYKKEKNTRQTEDNPLYQPKLTPEEIKINIAKLNLKAHAKYLLAFTYDSSDPYVCLVKNLSFLYHFHRYNLNRFALFADNQADDIQHAINLRTLAVHNANKVDVTEEVILETQQQIQQFVVQEVAQLEQNHSYYWVKSDTVQSDIVDLAGTSVRSPNLESMQTTSLFKLLDREIDQSQPTDKDVINWIEQKIIPFIHLLYIQNDLAQHERFAAIKMLIIIMGEYCAPNRTYKLKLDYLEKCRSFRNKLAHNIFNVNEKRFDEFVEELIAINAILPHEFPTKTTLVPLTSVFSPRIIQRLTIFTPLPEPALGLLPAPSLNPKATEFRPTTPSSAALFNPRPLASSLSAKSAEFKPGSHSFVFSTSGR